MNSGYYNSGGIFIDSSRSKMRNLEIYLKLVWASQVDADDGQKYENKIQDRINWK